MKGGSGLLSGVSLFSIAIFLVQLVSSLSRRVARSEMVLKMVLYHEQQQSTILLSLSYLTTGL